MLRGNHIRIVVNISLEDVYKRQGKVHTAAFSSLNNKQHFKFKT